MLGSSVGGWRVGRVNWSRHEGVYAAACVVAGDELAVSLDTDELPVRIWIAGISSHVLLGSVRWPPALPVGGPEESVCGLDVFREIEGIVSVGSEVFGEVDRELVELVVGIVAISSGVANGDRRIFVEVVSCPASEVAVLDVGLDHRLKLCRRDFAVYENSHVNVYVAAFVGFEDSKTFVTSSVESPIERTPDSVPRFEEAVEMVNRRQGVPGVICR